MLSPILSHPTSDYNKMGPPSFHDKGPLQISPYPELSSAKDSKSEFFDGLIPKKLTFVEGDIPEDLH